MTVILFAFSCSVDVYQRIANGKDPRVYNTSGFSDYQQCLCRVASRLLVYTCRRLLLESLRVRGISRSPIAEQPRGQIVDETQENHREPRPANDHRDWGTLRSSSETSACFLCERRWVWYSRRFRVTLGLVWAHHPPGFNALSKATPSSATLVKCTLR